MVEAIRGHLLTVPMGSYLPVGLCTYGRLVRQRIIRGCKMIKFDDNYSVDEYGNVYSHMYGKLRKLKPYISKKGYVMYRLRIDNKTVQFSGHHLSYFVNVGKFDTSDGLQIDHIDGNKLNNHYSNLRRVTASVNARNPNTITYGRQCTNKLNLDVEEIRSLLKRGYSQREIAKMFNCCRATIRNYLRGYSIKDKASSYYRVRKMSS